LEHVLRAASQITNDPEILAQLLDRRHTLAALTRRERDVRRSTCAILRGCAVFATGSTGSTRSRWTLRRWLVG
jgi:hypothetical protein